MNDVFGVMLAVFTATFLGWAVGRIEGVVRQFIDSTRETTQKLKETK